jgi:GNAT superfamily N-acetyltransferase
MRTHEHRAVRPVIIRPVEARDRPHWAQMWAGYLAFYEASVDAATTEVLWTRLSDPSSPVHGLVAEGDDGIPVGLCHYVLHANTWEIAPVCYLEDLFVRPDARARGVGAALIEHLRGRMTTEGWSRLYWMTREDNYRARGLYDRFTKRDPFVRYVLRAGG